jgi:hypothetical protein
MVWVCIVLAVLGLTGKGTARNKAPEGAGQAVLNNFGVAANRAGMVRKGSWNLTVDGTYRATAFGLPGCDGTLLSVPLPRNAEGAGLLKRALRAPPQSLFYLLNGNRYDTFPNTTFWISGLYNDALRLAGMTEAPSPAVLAVAEQGFCNLVSRLDLSEFSAGTDFARSPLN